MIEQNYYLIKKDLRVDGMIQEVYERNGKELLTTPLSCEYPLRAFDMFTCSSMQIGKSGCIQIIIDNVVFRGQLTQKQMECITKIDQMTFDKIKQGKKKKPLNMFNMYYAVEELF